MFEPIADPVTTEGPSSPTDPPRPTVIELAIKCPYIWTDWIKPFRFPIEYKTKGTLLTKPFLRYKITYVNNN